MKNEEVTQDYHSVFFLPVLQPSRFLFSSNSKIKYRVNLFSLAIASAIGMYHVVNERV